MLCKAEIVCGGIVDTEKNVVVIIHGKDFCCWASEHSSVVEPKLVLHKFIHVFGCVLNPLEDVSAPRTAKARDFSCLEDRIDIH